MAGALPLSDRSLVGKAADKAAEKPEFDWLVKLIVSSLLAAGTGYTAAGQQDANQVAVVQSNREEIEKLKADMELFRSGFLQRVDVEENERERVVRRLERRITWLEATTGRAAPRSERGGATP